MIKYPPEIKFQTLQTTGEKKPRQTRRRSPMGRSTEGQQQTPTIVHDDRVKPIPRSMNNPGARARTVKNCGDGGGLDDLIIIF
ncbi:hypothetical protein T10_4423 [Trichinella papuae]|uniref:Uncharacterized protein n=1 Tax=Trichinella papuae TaxID=268474 RepID=A0A0V1ME57_9BILA|nr:hypothetical protein T10_4423 [Trichinella papuae]